ncbi:MAG: hypothetical protein R3C28_06350 [Pirellulaceae bacterium]
MPTKTKRNTKAVEATEIRGLHGVRIVTIGGESKQIAVQTWHGTRSVRTVGQRVSSCSRDD